MELLSVAGDGVTEAGSGLKATWKTREKGCKEQGYLLLLSFFFFLPILRAEPLGLGMLDSVLPLRDALSPPKLPRNLDLPASAFHSAGITLACSGSFLGGGRGKGLGQCLGALSLAA